ncbi:apoptosis-inducing factor 3 [Eucyclogobius newberryi]|uniref:apoptosis-inducing factor 3 n=1 Tax=Eucyclogobius newberryi TaxID=166745 RepID=UPI003B5B1B1E
MSVTKPPCLLESDPDEDQDEVTEAVCLESDLREGQMMEVEVGGHTVLLTRTEGKYSALENQCTHYGAPLSKGVISGTKVRCPWHGSCFNTHTGDVEEFPGIDSLPCHKVKIENKKVYVSINKKTIRQGKRIKHMGGAEPGNAHTVLLIGGGATSLSCAETLRQENYSGRIIMVSRDYLLPYDKTRLSKVMNVQSESILLRGMEFYQKYDIEVWLKIEAKSLDTEAKTVTFDNGTVQSYDQLLVSTGCRAKVLDVPGMSLKNVLMLETPEDARQIHAVCEGSRIVLVGTSFVGMEVASYMLNKASDITVIGSSELPYHNTLGKEIGKITLMMLVDNGVKFHMNEFVTEIRGENGTLKDIVLKSGTVIPADVLIVGIGVNPNSELLRETGIKMDQKRFVVVDKYMRTSVPNVFSGGDVCTFPLTMAQNQQVNIGHWQMAQAHGRVAALNMLGKRTELKSVPYYWTVLLGKTIRYAGFGEGYTEVIIKGKVEDRKFLGLYIKDEKVVAAVSLNYDPAVSAVAERLLSGRVITKMEALSDDLSWLKLP